MRLTICLTALLIASSAYAELPQISDPRINQPPPGAPVAAGYFTINNTTEETLVITGARSEQGEIEVHLSEIVDDVATMSEQQSVTIEAGERLEFKHGSYHLMFMGMSDVLTPEAQIQVTLETNQGDVSINMPVVPPGGSHGSTKHDSMSMDHGESMQHEGDAAAQ